MITSLLLTLLSSLTGTRLCKQDGNWDNNIYCFTSEHFKTVLSKV